MNQQKIITLAQNGDTKAISSILRKVLSAKKINVGAITKNNSLYLLFESEDIPSYLFFISFVKKIFINLKIFRFDNIYIYGRKKGEKKYNWKYSLVKINTPEKKYIEVESKYFFSIHKIKFLASLVGVISFIVASGVLLNQNRINANNPIENKSQDSREDLNILPNSTGIVTIQELSHKNKNTIKIKAVGDVIPGTNFPRNRLISNKNKLFGSVEPYFHDADLIFGNFESTLTNHPYSAKDMSRAKVFAFRTPPEYAQLLREVGFDVLSVANNHSFDFYKVGFEDTIKNIEAAGMKAVGRKGEISYLEINNLIVSFIGFSAYDYHNTVNDLETAKKLVQEAKQKSDIIIVSVHAGAEGANALTVKNKAEYFYGENRGNLVLFSHTVIDFGADLVLGHGPHVPRAIELYNNRLIAYSLGNFLGYRTLSTVGYLGYSMILEVEMDHQGGFIKAKIIPIKLDCSGIPHIDQYFHSVSLMRNLVESDFPGTPLMINGHGEILFFPNSPLRPAATALASTR